MSEPRIPESALLRPRRPGDVEGTGAANDFNQDWLWTKRNPFNLPAVEFPSLPTTKAHNFRNYPSWENIPLCSSNWIAQPYRRNRKFSSCKTNRRGNTLPRESVEEQESSTEFEFDLKDGREIAHNTRKGDLSQQLEPLLGDAAALRVLLCWGEKHHCSIVPIRVSNDSTDEASIWREINKAWYSQRGSWRRYVPVFGIEHIEVVEVSIAGMDSAKTRGSKKPTKFVGMYTTEDMHEEKERVGEIIENYQEQDFPCPYITSTGTVDCLQGCVSRDLDVRCPESLLFEAQRKLQNIETRSLMKLAFYNSNLANLNDFLQQEGLVYGHNDILAEINQWHCPKLRELRFRGILIKEGWRFRPKHLVISLAVSLSFSLVASARYVFGGWATAWTVGCFFVGLLTFLLQRV